MSIELSLLGWSATGLRCPDHTIDLRKSDTKPYRVSLVQMPNGTGKTTTLRMLRAALSGVDWEPEQIRQMRASSDSASKGQFVVRLAVNDRPLTFELNLNFDTGEARYRTTQGAGVQDGFRPPSGLAPFLSPRFVELFVFDGELASDLLNPHKTRAKEAVDALFQLPLFDEVAKEFGQYWDTYTEKVTASNKRALTQRRNRLSQIRERARILELQQKALKEEQNTLKDQVERARLDYETSFKKDKNIGQRLDALKFELREAEDRVGDATRKVIDELRNPHALSSAFGISLLQLKSKLDRLKLPSSTSREFFEELSQADVCVCGRALDDAARSEVRRRADEYLAEDEVGVLNSIKSDIAAFCRGDPTSFESELDSDIGLLERMVQKRADTETELRALESERLGQGDSDLDAKKAQLDALELRLSECDDQLDEIEREPLPSDGDDTDCLKALRAILRKAERDLAEITETVKLKAGIDIVTGILVAALEASRRSLRSVLVADTNDRIKKLLARRAVQIQEIQDSLLLKGQAGASMGQTLSVAYAFLSTLFSRATHHLPFIVDSPAGALDLAVRPEVAGLLPQLCSQFVAFTISSERDRFAEPLADAAKNDISYFTIFRSDSLAPPLERRLKDSRIRQATTANGIIVNDKSFFQAFDQDRE